MQYYGQKNEKFNDYKAFVEKFKPKCNTDVNLNPRPSILNYRLKGSKNPKNSEDSGSTFYSKIQGTAEPL